MENNLQLDEIKKLFPDEWVLLGNPEMDENKLNVVSFQEFPFITVRIKKKFAV